MDWEVAHDQGFRRVVRSGTFVTGPGRDHTVKVDVTRLKPATWYFYRFSYASGHSRIGRMRTAPARRSLPSNLRFGVVSCANWQAGYFAAYRGLAQRNDLHAILHLGDYFYEYGPTGYGNGPDDTAIRVHDPKHEIVTLEDYRRRHAQYKTDPDLQSLHARYPFIVTWDDHEVTNDAWKSGAENHQANEGSYGARRARAYRAYDEWMPVRMEGTADLRDGTRLFRRLQFGRLAELSMLDLRSYRSKQVTPHPVPVPEAVPVPLPGTSPDVAAPGRTILGSGQMAWLKQTLSRRHAQWKIIGNPVMIAPISFVQLPADLIRPVNNVTGLIPDDGFPFNVDQWDGYTEDRREIYRHIRDHQVQDAVFVTGDIHSAWASELPYDVGGYPVTGATAGVEFVCSSVTSNNLKDEIGTSSRAAPNLLIESLILANNRHIKYLNFDDHGFSVLDLTPARAQMDWFIIGSRADRRTSIKWTQSYATKTGTGKIGPVDRPVR